MALNPDILLLIQQLQQQAAKLTVLQAQVAAQAMVQLITAPVPIFVVLTPALAQIGIIDFSSGMGIKLRKSIMAPLMMPYDGSSTHLTHCLDEVKCCAMVCGWDNNLLMISDQKQPPENHHLITTHGCLTLKNVHHHVTQYVRQQNCTDQDAFMMFEVLCDSLTSNAHACVTLESKKYLIRPDNMANGPCFLKAILIKFHIETNATNYHLMTQHIALPKTIVTMHSNVAMFNSKVTRIMKELAASGQTSSDLLMFLFLAYQEVEDKDFAEFIKILKMHHDSGIQQIMSQELMDHQALIWQSGCSGWHIENEDGQAGTAYCSHCPAQGCKQQV